MGWSSYNSTHTLSAILIFIAQACYMICFVPQIIENLRQRSESGLSDAFLINNFNGYVFWGFDIFCNQYPDPYKWTFGIQLIGMSTLIIQRFYYANFSLKKTNIMFGFFWLNAMAALTLIPLSIKYQFLMGECSAWIITILTAAGSISQAIKIQKSASVEGFSYLFMAIFSFASLCEFILCLRHCLSLPYLIYTVQDLCMFVIFTLQFIFFSKQNSLLKTLGH